MFRVVYNTQHSTVYYFLFSFLFLSFLFSPLADQKPFFSLFPLPPSSSLSPIFILFQPFITSSSFSSHCICPSSTKKKQKKHWRSPTITTTTTSFFFSVLQTTFGQGATVPQAKKYATRSATTGTKRSALGVISGNVLQGGRPSGKMAQKAKMNELVDDDQTMMSISGESFGKVAPSACPAGVVDIDADRSDAQTCGTYAQDIHKYMLAMEVKWQANPGYMSGHTGKITPKMRGVLIDWLVEVHYRFDLLQETMFLTTILIDRYLSKASVEKKKLQLVGVTAMLIASKYEEMWPPEVNDFVYMTDNAYTKEEIIAMEGQMLNTLQYALGNPLPTQFVQRYVTASGANTDTQRVAGYIMELSITSYDMVSYKQSTLAASALVLAGQITGQSMFGASLQYYSGYSLDQLTPCMKALQGQLKASVASDATLKAIRKKHSKTKFHSTSQRDDVVRYIAGL